MSASEPETEIKKRLYVGGLSKGVTEDELKQRFELFVKVPSIHVKFQTDGEGNHVKTFAHMDVQGTESGLKKLYNAYQNAKWRGSVLKLEDAKESFLDRLSVERKEEKKKQMDLESGKSKKRKVEEWKTPDLDKLKVTPVPGTPVPGKKDWVVGKYGRVLPVLNVKKSYVTKAVKHDPSKFCHASKVFKEDDGDLSTVNCDSLTWEIDQPDSEITKKRKGEFPVDARPKKKLKVSPVEVSKSSPVKDKSSSNKSSPVKEKSSNKSSPVKEKSSNNSWLKENSAKSGEIYSGQYDDGSGAVTEDGLEIVKVGGKYQSQKKCAVRSRFDSDYESDSSDNTEQSIKVNNKNSNNNAKAQHVKSSKTTNISTDLCDKDESEGGKKIPEFKGIGSLVARPDVASPGKKNTRQNKTLPDYTKATVCNGALSRDKDKKEAETNSKNKRKKEPLSDLQKSSLIQVKKPADEKNSLSAMQQNASQYADLLLSEFVAKAPQNRPQSRQKYDPYDSDLDSDNFELVAKKLAKRAGIETGGGMDNGRKKGKQSVNHDKEYNTNNRTNGDTDSSLTNLMFSMAGGYSSGRKATAAVAESNNRDSSTSKIAIPNMNGNNVEESQDIKRVEDSSDDEEEENSSDDEEEENSNKIRKDMKTVSGGKNKQSVKNISHEKDDTSEEDGSSDDECSSDDDDGVKNKKKIDSGKGKKKNEDSDEDDSSDEEEESSGDEVVQSLKKAGGEEAKKKIQESSSEGDSDSSEDEEEEEGGSEKGVKDNKGAGDDDEGEDESSGEEDDICDKNEKSVNGKTQEVEDGSGDEDDIDEEESSSDEDEDSDKKVAKIKKKVGDKKDQERTKDSSSSDDEEEEDSSDEEDSSEKVQVKNKKADDRGAGKKTVDNSSDEEEDESSDEEKDGSSDNEEEKSSDHDESEESETVRSEKIFTGSVQAVPAGDAKVTTGMKRKASRRSSSSSSSDEEEEEVKDDNGEAEAQEVSLAEEKLKNLKVLENVVGKDKVDKLTAKLKKNNVFIMDMNQLRFDPTKLQPSPSGQKDTTVKKTKPSLDISFKKEVHIKTEPLSPKDTNLKGDKKQEKERDRNQERFDPPKLVSPKKEPTTQKTKSLLNVSVKKEVEENESDTPTHEETGEEAPKEKTRKRAEKQKKERDMNEHESDSPTTPSPREEVTAKQKKKKEKKKKKDIALTKEAEEREGETKDSTPDVPLSGKTQKKQDKELQKGRVVESATRSAVTVSDLFMKALKSGTHSGQTDQGREASVGQASASSFSLLDMFDKEERMDTDSQPSVKPLSALPDPSKLRGSSSQNVPKSKVKPQGSKDVPITPVTKTDTASNKAESQKNQLKKLKAAHDKALKDAGRVDVRFSKDDWKAKNFQIRQNILKICKNRHSFAVRKKKNEEVRESGKAVRRFGSWNK